MSLPAGGDTDRDHAYRSSHRGQASAAVAYVLASALGVFVCLVAFALGADITVVLLAYATPCGLVLVLHIGVAVVRMFRPPDQVIPSIR
ncbi:hypothetical protein OO012_07215 [Rhodobacteraceae bacterium KMM 6894]|nr:hypothetical protein [Rhodobacteraceae bacterium KMM 6894]